MSTISHSVPVTLEALSTLYSNPDKTAKKQANEYLQEFQHSVDAWQICNDILGSPASPPEAKLFASQTFRTKILYDLKDIPQTQIFPLRDSLNDSLNPLIQPNAPSGSRAIRIQICTAIADLALQVGDWTSPVRDMIARFGKDPSTMALLLEFLQIYVEEATNGSMPVFDWEDKVTNVVEPVMEVLVTCIQGHHTSPEIPGLVFNVFRQWLISGELPVPSIVQTPLFTASFDALASDQLFDAAVGVCTTLIHETQEVEDNMDAVQAILPRIIALRPQLEVHKDDAERIKGYAQIFAEAGECYTNLIIRHPVDLFPLVQALAECAAYPDLEIVPYTFESWYLLASAIGKDSTDPSMKPILGVFEQLQSSITGHLHFPPDNEPQTPAERDEFRAFRHQMGDTLKDCCHVLGPSTCLRRSYDLIVTAMQQPNPSWQQIEAPLFSMRSMGAEVKTDDDEVLPRIMDLLPTLPSHPRIQYAAILVIGRYTQWVDRHPGYIEGHLRFISAGFEAGEDQVSAAAAMTMKFICQDCSQHLSPFLPQLHQFTTSAGAHLNQMDLTEIWEALGYVIADMPADQAAPMITQFLEPLLARIQEVAANPVEAGKKDLSKVADYLEQMQSMLSVIVTLDPVPETCFATAGQIYGILDQILARYARHYFITERAGYFIRRGLAFFPPQALEPLMEPLLGRMVSTHLETGYPMPVWIAGKIASKMGSSTRGPQGEHVARILQQSFEAFTQHIQETLKSKPAPEMPDVMNDYNSLFDAYINRHEAALLSSPSLPVAVGVVISAITCPGAETQVQSLGNLELLVNRLARPGAQEVIAPILVTYGEVIFDLTIRGVVDHFPEDTWFQVAGLLDAITRVSPPDQVQIWAGKAVTNVPRHLLSDDARQTFMTEVNEHLATLGGDKLKNALTKLIRSGRQARERSRQSRKSLGA